MFTDIGIIVGVPILRGISGWLENALEDGEISRFEWGQLGSTVFRLGVVGFGVYYGFDLGAIASAGSAVVLDFLFKALKKTE